MSKIFGNLNGFRAVSIMASLLYLYLFAALLLFPESFCGDFGMTWSESLGFFARRASAFMICISVLLFLARNVPRSTARLAISFSVGVNMAGFALSSASRLASGYAKTSVLAVVFIEVLVAAVYFGFWSSDRRHLKSRDPSEEREPCV